jgi:hypothetical protein
MRARRVSVAALCLVGTVVPGAAETPQRKEVQALAKRVEVRVGVQHETLIVMPLVLREGVQPGRERNARGSDVAWSRDAKTGRVVLERTPGDARPPVLLPTGRLLIGDARERTLPRPAGLLPGESVRVRAPVCDSRPQPAEPGKRGFGPIAPLEQRKLMLLEKSAEDLALLQQIQGIFAELEGTQRTVQHVLAAQPVRDGVTARWAQLRKIPGAYGNRTVGHVAFFGFRPMELVLFDAPKTYRALARDLLRATAASHTIWSLSQEAATVPAAPTELRDLLSPTQSVLTACGKAVFEKERIGRAEAGRWKSWTGKTHTKARQREPWRAIVCRFATDETGTPVFLEAYEHGRELVLPAPLRRPGGKPKDLPPEPPKSGLGEEYLRRILQRIRERKERARRLRGR